MEITLTKGQDKPDEYMFREAIRQIEVQMPIWIFHGGRDLWVKPQWIYKLANALEQAGCGEVRLTIHEDLGHNSWTRVYAGEDLYQWFLAHKRK